MLIASSLSGGLESAIGGYEDRLLFLEGIDLLFVGLKILVLSGQVAVDFIVLEF